MVALVEFVSSRELHHEFEVHCELAHINQLILWLEFRLDVKIFEALKQDAFNIPVGLPVEWFVWFLLYIEEP